MWLRNWSCCVTIELLQGTLCQDRRCAFHYQWKPLLSSGTGEQCGRCRGCTVCVMQGDKHWLVPNAKKLGPELAVQWKQHGWSSIVFHDHHQRWQDSCVTWCSSCKLAIWSNFWRSPILANLASWGQVKPSHFDIILTGRHGICQIP